jgi:hypothetical protein
VVPDGSKIAADLGEIRADLTHMTRRWGELADPVMLELRAFKPGSDPKTAKYSPDFLDEAVNWAAALNGYGYNVYAVRNPIRATIGSRSASDADIVAAFYLWADCDDEGSADNVRRFDGPKWSAAVITGRTPGTRVHVYWELETPCTDLAAWRRCQEGIAAHFGSDRTVVNPSRIMRVAGTINYPDARKRDRGYATEPTLFRPADGKPVTLDGMARAFGAAAPQPAPQAATAPAGAAFQIEAYTPPLDRAGAAAAALSGTEWHNNTIRLVASYVARGMSDDEIHALTERLTLPGYTADQTRREVQQAIDGARRKGWTPQQQAAPNFNFAPDAPPEEAWRIQPAADFIADYVAPEYIVDGVIQRGRVYTLTAPTGSGKTAVMLYASLCISTGMAFCDRDVEAGDVLFLAGENPDDVRARVIATLEFMGINPAACRMHFIAGTFSIRADMEKLRTAAEALPNLILVVVDTFAAYFDGDDENSNAQALDFARLVRKIAAFQSKPGVVMPAHPVKNATRSNLIPKGGSSLLNEVDGNLTLWNDGGILTMHWQGKFRGAEFEPLSFELQRYETSAIADSQGRIMPTILAKPLLEMRALEIAAENLKAEDRVLLSISTDPALSVAERCVHCGILLTGGRAAKSKMQRILQKLTEQKLVRRFRTNWELTGDGERAAEMLREGRKFAHEA